MREPLPYNWCVWLVVAGKAPGLCGGVAALASDGLQPAQQLPDQQVLVWSEAPLPAAARHCSAAGTGSAGLQESSPGRIRGAAPASCSCARVHMWLAACCVFWKGVCGPCTTQLGVRWGAVAFLCC
jgi:hypothetical protein